MQENSNILDKVDFLIRKSISKNYTDEDLRLIESYSAEYSENLILGKVFGYSVSDYAFATLKWIGTSETIDLYNKLAINISNKRKSEIDELVRSKLYEQY